MHALFAVLEKASTVEMNSLLYKVQVQFVQQAMGDQAVVRDCEAHRGVLLDLGL